ncbi:Hypothetical predicted protein, partial [Pelobates cultripes]
MRHSSKKSKPDRPPCTADICDLRWRPHSSQACHGATLRCSMTHYQRGILLQRDTLRGPATQQDAALTTETIRQVSGHRGLSA